MEINPTNLPSRNRRKNLIGTIVSTHCLKTAVVSVETKKLHRIVKKLVISHKKYHVHNLDTTLKVGDLVEITETRPLSKLKCWRISRIIERSR